MKNMFNLFRLGYWRFRGERERLCVCVFSTYQAGILRCVVFLCKTLRFFALHHLWYPKGGLGNTFVIVVSEIYIYVRTYVSYSLLGDGTAMYGSGVRCSGNKEEKEKEKKEMLDVRWMMIYTFNKLGFPKVESATICLTHDDLPLIRYLHPIHSATSPFLLWPPNEISSLPYLLPGSTSHPFLIKN